MFSLNSRLFSFAVLASLILLMVGSMFAVPKTAFGAACADQSELLQNGNFETPVVTKGYGWDIYADDTPGLGWDVEWLSTNPPIFISPTGTDTRPTLGQLEIAKSGFEGFLPSDGNQWAELDADWSGPDMVGEPASIRIFQDIPTTPGRTYKLTFDFSPRPSAPPASENVLVLEWDGQQIDSIATSSKNSNQTEWASHEYILTATSNNTRLEFSDGGTPNSYGTYIDNVSLKCESDGSILPPSATSTLTVIKNVINDDSGTSTPADFTMMVSGTNVSTSTFPGSSTGTLVTLNAGAYAVTEASSTNYTTTLSADCSGNILAGENKTCTVTNNDVAPVPPGGGGGTSTLTVIKNVINDNGGTSTPSDFIMSVTGTNVSSSTFPGSSAGTVVTLDSGSYSVDETNVSGYAKSLSADCSGNVGAGESRTCTITNNDEDGGTGGGGGGGGDDDDDDDPPSRHRRSSGSVAGASVSPLSCSPATQNTSLNQPVTLTATGGDGDYTWTAGSGFVRSNTPNDTDSILTGSYSETGTKTVGLSSEDGQTVSCQVSVQGQVLGVLDVPGMPTTGGSGDLDMKWALILSSLFATIVSITLLRKHSHS